MIISDINYIKSTNEEVFGGSGFKFDKKVNSEVNNAFNFDSKIDIDKVKTVDVKIDAKADVKGNIAELTFDAEAVGRDTLVEVEASILTVEDELSSVAASIISVVA